MKKNLHVYILGGCLRLKTKALGRKMSQIISHVYIHTNITEAL